MLYINASQLLGMHGDYGYVKMFWDSGCIYLIFHIQWKLLQFILLDNTNALSQHLYFYHQWNIWINYILILTIVLMICLLIPYRNLIICIETMFDIITHTIFSLYCLYQSFREAMCWNVLCLECESLFLPNPHWDHSGKCLVNAQSWHVVIDKTCTPEPRQPPKRRPRLYHQAWVSCIIGLGVTRRIWSVTTRV